MTWEDVEARDDVIDGYFEFHEDGFVLVGRISGVIRQHGLVAIHMEWTARRPESAKLGKWTRSFPGVVSFHEFEVTPCMVGDQKITAVIPHLGMTTLYLKGAMKDLDLTSMKTSQ